MSLTVFSSELLLSDADNRIQCQYFGWIFRPVLSTPEQRNIPAATQRIFLFIYPGYLCVFTTPRTHRFAFGAAAVATHLLLESGAVSKRGGTETRSKFLIEFHAGLVALL